MTYSNHCRATQISQYKLLVTALHVGIILIVFDTKDEPEFPFSPFTSQLELGELQIIVN